ncbi:MAG: TenA family protein [Bacteroidales bacterium]
MEAAGLFTKKMWEHIQSVYMEIINCRFVRGLAEGTLSMKCFAHYLSQDILYLIDDTRALAVMAARSENPDEIRFFLQLARDGLDIEHNLHDDFLNYFNISEATEKSPAFKAYADFLLDNAFNSDYSVAVAALLPCFWVYYETGRYILKNSVNNNPYKKWIDTYSDTEYQQYTKHFIEITENLGQKSSPGIQEKMIRTFTEGAKHELKVFEEAAGKL